MDKLPFNNVGVPGKNQGQMLIGVLIAIAVFLILSHALFTLISASSNLVSINKARTTAKFIAIEKIETIKNIAYEDVGTAGGIPNGILVPEEIVNKNGLNFLIKTNVVYIDDSFDSEGEIDLFPDYKRIRVEVSWEGIGSSRKSPLIILTDISPAMNIWAEGTGMLDIYVTDAYGEPVVGANVNIYADTITPNVNIETNSDEFGKVTFPGAIPCIECYQIDVSKDGYSTDSTHSTTEVTNPTKPHASVLEGKMTQLSFSIDKTGSIEVESYSNQDNVFTLLPNTSFILRGTKSIGTDAYLQPVYKYYEELITDSQGKILVNDLEWDSYYIEASDPSIYSIAGVNPILPLVLLPQANETIDFFTSSFSPFSLYNIAQDPSQNLLSDVYIKLEEGEFEQEIISGNETDPNFGQAFFTNLEEKSYTITATASGYQNYSNIIEIMGNVQNVIILNSL